jgi:hypothetical protein
VSKEEIIFQMTARCGFVRVVEPPAFFVLRPSLNAPDNKLYIVFPLNNYAISAFLRGVYAEHLSFVILLPRMKIPAWNWM